VQPFWTVAQTLPFCEQRAARFLTGQGFEHYLPVTQVTRIIRHRKQKRTLALFPRYIFVRVIDQWHSIKSTIGISHLIYNEEKRPAVVRDEVINYLKGREDSRGIVQLPKKEEFVLGQNIRIVGGRFDGRMALYDGMSRRNRERVLLQLLGQSVSVELNIDSHVEAVLTPA